MPRSILIGIIGIPLLATALVASGWLGLPAGYSFTGYCQGDELLYTAKSLEIFESGHRLRYGNPFSDDPGTPVVYVSLIFSAIGWIWRLTGIEPVWILWGGRLAGGALTLLCAWRLIRLCVGDDPEAARWCFYWAALGSGLGWIFASAHGALLQLHGSFDPILAGVAGGDGLQLFGWLADRVKPTVPQHYSPGIFTTIVHAYAAIYQAFFLATCVALAERRRVLAVVLFALSYWAHPWAGSMLLCLGGSFLAIELVLERSRGDLATGIAFALIGAAWLAYYLVFLDSIPEARQHAEQVRNPPYDWRTPITHLPQYLGAWGTALVGVVLLPWRGTWRRVLQNRGQRLVALWVLICFVILNNHRFLDQPLQPDQLGGRWLWLPLVILATLALRHLGPVFGRRALMVLVLVSLPETVRLSYGYFVADLRRNRALVRPPELSAALRAVAELPGRRLVFSDDPELAYVIVAHTPHRSYFSHWCETPHLVERIELLERFRTAPKVAVPDSLGADLLALTAPVAAQIAADPGELGEVLHRSADYVVVDRAGAL